MAAAATASPAGSETNEKPAVVRAKRIKNEKRQRVIVCSVRDWRPRFGRSVVSRSLKSFGRTFRPVRRRAVTFCESRAARARSVVYTQSVSSRPSVTNTYTRVCNRPDGVSERGPNTRACKKFHRKFVVIAILVRLASVRRLILRTCRNNQVRVSRTV